MQSTKIKGGSGLSTNYVIRSTKNPKGGQTESKGGQKLQAWDCNEAVRYLHISYYEQIIIGSTDKINVDIMCTRCTRL